MRHRVSAIIIKDKRILLIYRFKNGNEYYAVPGGGIEENESPEEAMVREVKEETGLNIALERKLEELEIGGQKESFFLVRRFEGKPTLGGPEKERQSDDNVYRLEWIDLVNLPKINLRPEVKEIILSLR